MKTDTTPQHNGIEEHAVQRAPRAPVPARRSDADIARDVETGLRWSASVPSGAIKVTVERGCVTLSGDVEWAFQKQAAADSVRYLLGVTGVHDRIAITAPKPTTTPATTGSVADSTREWEETLPDGTRIRVRAVHADDIELERRFILAMSPASRRFRFLAGMSAPSDALLKQMTAIDPATDAAYLALAGTGPQTTQIGVARFSAQADGHDCEFAVTVADAWQNKGLGTLLMKRLMAVAKARGIQSMHSSDSADNTRMRQFSEHLHFRHERDPDDATLVRYSVDLAPHDAITATPTPRAPRA